MSESKELAVFAEALNPAVVFSDGGVDDILAKITTEVRAVDTDISTATGRTAIASLAYKIARSKTALDDMGKALVAEWKAKSAGVDAERRRIREALDALKDEVRKPLTEWEQAEKDRVAEHEKALAELMALSTFDAPPTMDAIKSRLDSLIDNPVTEWRDWQEFTKRAMDARVTVVSDLQTLLATTEKWEVEQAELVKLRAEKAEREQKERDDKIRLEAAETAKREAEQAAKAEQAAIERERQAAEARALVAEREASEALAKAERAVELERERVAKAAAIEAAETARRESDRKHKAKINNEALTGLVDAGLTQAAAKRVVTAIVTGKIPHVKITY